MNSASFRGPRNDQRIINSRKLEYTRRGCSRSRARVIFHREMSLFVLQNSLKFRSWGFRFSAALGNRGGQWKLIRLGDSLKMGWERFRSNACRDACGDFNQRLHFFDRALHSLCWSLLFALSIPFTGVMNIKK